ncbi:MAG TPA: MlaD family protein [Verrucomicrobiae bacterium]|nr:MlaD family protein [Verrucomicrobiae bacterium]
MPLQDLTPQLRTRLSRMERAVGWFVFVAVVLLVFAFGYYIYNTAERKGWFRTKAPYFIFTDSATGLKVGDPVTLMGLNVGQITVMEPMSPESQYNMYVEFELRAPYFGYMWTEGSFAEVSSSGLLGGRALEVTKGTNGYPIYAFNPLDDVSLAEVQSSTSATNWVLGEEIFEPNSTNLVAKPLEPLTNLAAIVRAGYSNIVVLDTSTHKKWMTGIWDRKLHRYEPYKKGDRYWLPATATPAVSDQLQAMIAEVQAALPSVFNLTNSIQTVLSNSAELTSNLNVVATSARPAVSNLTAILQQMNRPGALGQWLLPTNVNSELEGLLGNANVTLTNADVSLVTLASNLNVSLNNLAGITGNLRDQVVQNPTLLRNIADTIVHADELVQGLKKFWLFRHLFPQTTGPSPQAVPLQNKKPLVAPKAKK